MGRHRFRWGCNPWLGGFLYRIGQLCRYIVVETTDSELDIVLYWRGEQGTGFLILNALTKANVIMIKAVFATPSAR